MLLLPKQSIHLRIRNGAFGEGRVGACCAGFVGDAAEQPHGGAVRTGAIAHALDAQLCQFRKRRHAGAGENVDRSAMEVVDELADVVRVAQAGDKDAVATGFEIDSSAFQGVAQSFFGSYAGLPIGVNAGVDDEVYLELAGGAARGLNALDLLRQRKERTAVGMAGKSVFKVHAHSASVDDLSDGCFELPGVGGKAGFDIGSDGKAHAASDALDEREHVIPGNMLAVGITERVGAGSAAGGDGGQSAVRDHGGAGSVPCVDENQRGSGVVKLKEGVGFLCLRHLDLDRD